jgi:hypothetical protein
VSLRTLLASMLQELESGRLVVAKWPSSRGGYVRGALSCNCEWYRHLCGRHLGYRRRHPRARTIIKRQATVLALQRMIRGNLRGVYAERILDAMADLGILAQHAA